MLCVDNMILTEPITNEKLGIFLTLAVAMETQKSPPDFVSPSLRNEHFEKNGNSLWMEESWAISESIAHPPALGLEIQVYRMTASYLERGRGGTVLRGNASENFSALSWQFRTRNLILKISENLSENLWKPLRTFWAVTPLSVTPLPLYDIWEARMSCRLGVAFLKGARIPGFGKIILLQS